jgi:predicted nucleic acid-binding protein
MNSSRSLVLDANILIRAVLGKRVLGIILAHSHIALFSPIAAYDDARKYLPQIVRKQHGDINMALRAVDELEPYIIPVPPKFYQSYYQEALDRIEKRDPNGWPILACALALNCPIWTEDHDFFGTGVATWTTDRVELYFRSSLTGSPQHHQDQ